MKSLLHIEWIKVKSYRNFWTLLGLCIASIFTLNFMAYRVISKASGGDPSSAGPNPYHFPELWQTVAYFSGFLHFLPGIIIITLVTNEFIFRTHRQGVIDGLSRRQFIHGKILLILCLSLLFTVAVYLCAILFGFAIGRTPTAEGSAYPLFVYLQAVSQGGVALLIALVFKKPGISIGFYFVYLWIIEKMASAVLNLAGDWRLGNYLPLSASDKLIPFPFQSPLPDEFSSEVNVPLLLVAVAFYYVAAYLLSMRQFTQKDL